MVKFRLLINLMANSIYIIIKKHLMKVVFLLLLALLLVNTSTKDNAHCLQVSSNSPDCIKCLQNYHLLKGNCYLKIEACLEYSQQNQCTKCQGNYQLIENFCCGQDCQNQRKFISKATLKENQEKKQFISSRLLQTQQNIQNSNTTDIVVITNNDQTSTYYFGNYPQSLLDLINAQNSDSTSQGQTTSNQQVVVQAGSTTIPYTLNRIVSTQVMSNWDIRQLSFVYRNGTSLNGGCYQKFYYYLDFGNGTQTYSGTKSKNQTSSICSNPSAYDLGIVDPSVVIPPSNTTTPNSWSFPIKIYLKNLYEFDVDFWTKNIPASRNRNMGKFNRQKNYFMLNTVNYTFAAFMDTFFSDILYLKQLNNGWDLSSSQQQSNSNSTQSTQQEPIVITNNDQTSTYYFGNYPQSLLDLINAQNSDSTSQGQTTSNQQVVVQAGSTTIPYTLNRIVSTQVMSNWDIRQLSFVYRNGTSLNGGCYQQFYYYLDFGNGTQTYSGTKSKNQTSSICSNPSAYDLGIVDPSVVIPPSNTTTPNSWSFPIKIYLKNLYEFDVDFWTKNIPASRNRNMGKFNRQKNYFMLNTVNYTFAAFMDTFFSDILYLKQLNNGWDLSSSQQQSNSNSTQSTQQEPIVITNNDQTSTYYFGNYPQSLLDLINAQNSDSTSQGQTTSNQQVVVQAGSTTIPYTLNRIVSTQVMSNWDIRQLSFVYRNGTSLNGGCYQKFYYYLDFGNGTQTYSGTKSKNQTSSICSNPSAYDLGIVDPSVVIPPSNTTTPNSWSFPIKIYLKNLYEFDVDFWTKNIPASRNRNMGKFNRQKNYFMLNTVNYTFAAFMDTFFSDILYLKQLNNGWDLSSSQQQSNSNSTQSTQQEPIVITNNDQTSTYYFGNYPQSLLDLINAQNSDSTSQGQTTSNQQVVVQAGSTTIPYTLNRIVSTQVMSNWDIRQLSFVYRNGTSLNGGCYQKFYYYLDFGNGTQTYSGTKSKNQTSSICSNPSAYDLGIVDPSVVIPPSNTTTPNSWSFPIKIYLKNLYEFDVDFWTKNIPASRNRNMGKFNRQKNYFMLNTVNYTFAAFMDTFFSDILYLKQLNNGWDLSSSQNTQQPDNSQFINFPSVDQASKTSKSQLVKLLEFVRHQKSQLIDSTLQQYSVTQLEGAQQFNLYLVKHQGQNKLFEYTMTVIRNEGDNSMKISVYQQNQIMIDQDIAQNNEILESSGSSQSQGNLRSSN